MPQDTEDLALRGEVRVREQDDERDLDRALALLDDAEAAAGLPLVDEAERHRLGQLAAGEYARGETWRSVLAWRGERAVGYGAVVVDHESTTTGDVAVAPGTAPGGGQAVSSADDQQTFRALLAATVVLHDRAGGGHLQVWTRQAGQAEADAADVEGFVVERRLAVMGRALGPDLGDPPPAEATVRAYRPGEDDEAVVAVLAGAYEGTGDAGWDLVSFRERTRLPWFRPGDLLVAEPTDGAGPRIAGLHWLKRRDATQGEVYNLAIHPAAQGRGLGPLLLHAGLQHLRETGHDDVLLWVDLANQRAVELYESLGFAVRWLDLALGRDPAPSRG